MVSETDFDLESYYEILCEGAVEAFIDFHDNPSYDAQDALVEAVDDAADNYHAHSPVGDAIDVLKNSPNEPDEWKPFVSDDADWRKVLQVMAYSTTRQDVYDALAGEGYVDEHWNPTDKLTGIEA